MRSVHIVLFIFAFLRINGCYYNSKWFVVLLVFYRTTHMQLVCIARHMLWPGVCLSRAGIVSKRLNVIELMFGTEATLGLFYTLL